MADDAGPDDIVREAEALHTAGVQAIVDPHGRPGAFALARRAVGAGAYPGWPPSAERAALAGGTRFVSYLRRGPLAHPEEQGTFNPKVPGSRPGRPTEETEFRSREMRSGAGSAVPSEAFRCPDGQGRLGRAEDLDGVRTGRGSVTSSKPAKGRHLRLQAGCRWVFRPNPATPRRRWRPRVLRLPKRRGRSRSARAFLHKP